MPYKTVTVTMPEWVYEDILCRVKNMSAKVTEYVIKGYMAEQAKQSLNKPVNSEATKPLWQSLVNDPFSDLMLPQPSGVEA